MINFRYADLEATRTPSKVTATGLGEQSTGAIVPHRRRMPRPRFMTDKALNAAERGIALHMAMQFADFTNCTTEQGAKDELLRLRDKKFLTEKQVEAISPEKICAFVNSDAGKKMRTARSVRREFKFSVLVPADELLGREELSGDKVLLQGVMDMYFETDDGITIVDFKTDKHRPEGDTLEKYSEQLRIYRRALYEVTGKKAVKLILYLVSLGEYIEIK